MNIGVFKLITGEEIVAKYDGGLVDIFYISDPRVLSPVQTPQGLSVIMIPWFMGIPEAKNVSIRKENIVAFIPDIPKSLEDNYLQQTSKLDLTSRI